MTLPEVNRSRLRITSDNIRRDLSFDRRKNSKPLGDKFLEAPEIGRLADDGGVRRSIAYSSSASAPRALRARAGRVATSLPETDPDSTLH